MGEGEPSPPPQGGQGAKMRMHHAGKAVPVLVGDTNALRTGAGSEGL